MNGKSPLRTPIEDQARRHELALELGDAVDAMLAATSRGDEEVAIGEAFAVIRLAVEAANLARVLLPHEGAPSRLERSSRSVASGDCDVVAGRNHA